ncbi:VOC family protein [Nocardia higoensis]|uniref:VOC family protein n=1 Tax=Nocardia higoensis TaxID=228599 RepID=A0ABS0DCT4_9NOCA|nr:VOC family protein [Nocardia higoensis]MBF6354538.1 VOC family protein [Nocardia higoensis]
MIRWTWTFVDRPEDRFEHCLRFWSTITGTAPSPRRGEHGEFRTLLPDPARGSSAAIKMQSVGGIGGTHLDLDVEDIAAARTAALASGAVAVAEHPDYTVLRSPGGLLFCLTRAAAETATPAAAVDAPDGTRSRLDQICLDIGPSDHPREAAFWRNLTGWSHTAGRRPEFSRLRATTPMPVSLLLQRLDEDRPAGAHIDFSSSDIEATADWHASLGARVISRFEHWIVLHDPAGVAYCVTARDPDGV